jgi:hypothetical protein
MGGGSRPNFLPQACPNGAGLSGSSESRINKWFNTSCFVPQPAFTFGTVGRTLPAVRQDGIHNLDFALFKDFVFVGEDRLKLQVRGEAFNLLNHPQFGNPNSSAGSPTFGQITSQANNPRLVQVAAKLIW